MSAAPDPLARLVDMLADREPLSTLPFEWMVAWTRDGTIGPAWNASRDGSAVTCVAVAVYGRPALDALGALVAERAKAAVRHEPRSATILEAMGRQMWSLANEFRSEGCRYAAAFIGAGRGMAAIESLFIPPNASFWAHDVVLELTQPSSLLSAQGTMAKPVVSSLWFAQQMRRRFAAPTLAQLESVLTPES